MPESYKDLYQENQSSKEHSQIGNLLGKYTEDAQGNIQHALFFDYDLKGNIEEEHFYGNLTGKCTIPIKLDANNTPKTITSNATQNDSPIQRTLSISCKWKLKTTAK